MWPMRENFLPEVTASSYHTVSVPFVMRVGRYGEIMGTILDRRSEKRGIASATRPMLTLPCDMIWLGSVRGVMGDRSYDVQILKRSMPHCWPLPGGCSVGVVRFSGVEGPMNVLEHRQ